MCTASAPHAHGHEETTISRSKRTVLSGQPQWAASSERRPSALESGEELATAPRMPLAPLGDERFEQLAVSSKGPSCEGTRQRGVSSSPLHACKHMHYSKLDVTH